MFSSVTEEKEKEEEDRTAPPSPSLSRNSQGRIRTSEILKNTHPPNPFTVSDLSVFYIHAACVIALLDVFCFQGHLFICIYYQCATFTPRSPETSAAGHAALALATP